jgi:hypothetical protein
MDLKRKIEVAETAVRSISEHVDHDSVVLLAALDKVHEMVLREKDMVVSRQQNALDAALNAKP